MMLFGILTMSVPVSAATPDVVPKELQVQEKETEQPVKREDNEKSEPITPDGNLTLVDDTHIYVGDYTMFGPNVTVATAGHPILPELRERDYPYQYNAPVHIGRNCWLGAGVIVLPGITIGDNVVVGAGSVVTKDLPSNVIAVGNPCKVLREISEHDREFYFKGRRIEDLEELLRA